MKAQASIIMINDEEVVLNVIAGDGAFTDTVTVKATDNYEQFSTLARGRGVHDVVHLDVEIVEVITKSLKIVSCST